MEVLQSKWESFINQACTLVNVREHREHPVSSLVRESGKKMNELEPSPDPGRRRSLRTTVAKRLGHLACDTACKTSVSPVNQRTPLCAVPLLRTAQFLGLVGLPTLSLP